MPELPEVEVVKQSLEKYILNKKLLKIIVKNKKLRYPVSGNISKKLTNLKIYKVKRISKHGTQNASWTAKDSVVRLISLPTSPLGLLELVFHAGPPHPSLQ